MKAIYLLLLFLPFGALSQKWGKDTSIIYLDNNLDFTSAKKAAYVGISIKVEGGWLAYAVYPDTTPLLKAYYKDRQLKVKEGLYTVYYPKNIKAREGFFIDNQMTGVWRFWYPSGHLKDSGMISNNYLTGHWKSWHPNGALKLESYFEEPRSSTENQMLLLAQPSQAAPPYPGKRTGLFTSWYSNGIKESAGHFKNDRMEGSWQWYHTNGAPATEELYKEGKMTSLQCFDTTGRPAGDMCSIDKPALLKHYGNYKAFIYENLTWPDEARKKKIEGDVHVKFTVTEEGKLENLTITTEEPLLKKAVEDLFGQMKEWYPAVSHNRTLVWEGEITIPFRLQQDAKIF